MTLDGEGTRLTFFSLARSRTSSVRWQFSQQIRPWEVLVEMRFPPWWARPELQLEIWKRCDPIMYQIKMVLILQ